MVTKYQIILINGPNLNLLGKREPNKYGNKNLNKVILDLYNLAITLKIKFHHFQSNAEHSIIDCIHEVKNNMDFILINPAGFAHTSIAIRDALLSVDIPFIEIHISNIYKREKFRHHSYLSDIAVGLICGLGVNGYCLALQAAVQYLLSFKN